MIAVRASSGKGMRGGKKRKKKKETRGDKAWLRIFHGRHHFFLKLSRSRRRKRRIARNIDSAWEGKYSVSGGGERGGREEEGRENCAARPADLIFTRFTLNPFSEL